MSRKYCCSTAVQKHIKTYLSAHTGLAFLVLLVQHPLVQLTPQCLGLPGGELGLQTAVENLIVGRVEVQPPAEDVEGLEGSLTGRGLDEVLKQLAHIVPVLLHLSHAPSEVESLLC